MTQLPQGGRRGPAPPWPAGLNEPDDLSLWEELWATPMAAAWERFGYERAVARYHNVLRLAESIGDARKFHPQVFAEARQLEDRLGLNPLAMLRLRWEVSEDEIAEKRADRPAKSRPKVVDQGALAGS
jgi:hypothetical protein